MNLNGLLLSFLFLSLTAQAGPPTVTNVVALQRTGTKLVDIKYDVTDPEGDLVKVRIEISHDGGISYSVPVNTISGDVGNAITPGANKVIVWNAGVDWDGEFSETMRVKVIVSDGKGFPGLEWGREIPPGGFFMGRDGGVEGVGPGKHVNIPWSYWVSKFEITVEQFNEFLNTALSAGLIRRDGNNLLANQGAFPGVANGNPIFYLGDDISWSLNKFVFHSDRKNWPVMVPYMGAVAFAAHYGYDLPTDAEWEKAARGPIHDGLGEHWIYPWGNSISGKNANISASEDPFPGRSPVGSFKGNDSPGGLDMGNDYGLYDLIGNVAEWTRTDLVNIENYPPIESLNNAIHTIDRGSKVNRGGTYNDQPNSERLRLYSQSYFPDYIGFRVVRRVQP